MIDGENIRETDTLDQNDGLHVLANNILLEIFQKYIYNQVIMEKAWFCRSWFIDCHMIQIIRKMWPLGVLEYDFNI